MKPWCRVSGLGHWGSHQALLLRAEETSSPLRSHPGWGRFLSEYRPHHPAALFLAPQRSAFQQTMWLLPVLLVSGLPLLGSQVRQAPLPMLYSSTLYSARQHGLGEQRPLLGTAAYPAQGLQGNARSKLDSPFTEPLSALLAHFPLSENLRGRECLSLQSPQPHGLQV